MRARSPFVRCLALALAALAAGCQSSGGPEKRNLSSAQVQAERQATQAMARSAMARLYAVEPDARGAIEKASGFGVFDVTTVNAVLVLGAKGDGVIVDNATKQPTFMQAVRVGTGPGLGYQQVYQIFVFKSKQALEQFKLGGKAGGDLGASATAGTTTKAISFNPYIDVYQVTEKGLALQANWGGTAYYVDPDLN